MSSTRNTGRGSWRRRLNIDNSPELFAATPPLEFINLEMRKPPEEGKAETIHDPRYFKGPFLYPPQPGTYTLRPPPEDAEPGMVGKLEKSLCRTHDAALNWTEAHTKVFIVMGYKKGLSSPCSFHHSEWDLSTVVHGDDFFTEGPADSLIKLNTALKQNFQVETEIIGPDAGQQLDARVLNRLICWEERGITWEPDPRHVEIMIANEIERG